MKRHGFTLFEILVVIAVIGIIAAIGGSSLHAYRQTLLLEQGAQEVSAVLTEARARARRVSADQQVVPTPGGTIYVLKEGTTTLSTQSLPNGVTFAAAPTEVNAVTFNAPYGLVEAANQTIRVQLSNGKSVDVHVVGMTGKILVRND